VANPEVERFFLKHAAGLSGADVEAVLMRARMKSVLENETIVDLEDVKSALEDFVPPSYPTEIELQTLAAVLECTSKSLLPAKYRDMDRGEVIRRANELAALTR
jgi:SpoVK/Ycf46/Vps4 family AAA+-type ATPase